MKPIVISLIISWILISGCQSANGQPVLEPSPAPTASTEPTTAPDFFAAASDTPVFEHGDHGSWYAAIVEPAAIVRQGDQLYMFYNGLTGWPEKAAVGLAVSRDGVNWEPVSDQPLLDSADADFEGFTFFASSVLALEDGTWAMYLYSLAEGRDGAPGKVLMATAPALLGPWTLMSDPVLLPGQDGSWDGSRVTQPFVIRAEGEYRMYYSGYENDRLQGGRWIGLATSLDGYRWTKLPEPVISFSENARDWDAFRVFQPRVVPVDDGYWLFYKSNVRVGRSEAWGLAFSPDGIQWEKADVNPVIDFQTFPIEWRRTGMAVLILESGTPTLYLEILEREGGSYHHGNADYLSNIFRFTAPGFP